MRNKILDDNLLEIKSYLTEKYKKEILGIVVFGSYISGKQDELSDIEIAIFLKKEYSFEKIALDKFSVEIYGYPLNRVKDFLENKRIRNKYETWYRTCFFLNMFRHCSIIYDPEKIVVEWKKIAREWTWSKKELREVYYKILENCRYILSLYSCNRVAESLISLRDTVNLLLVYGDMVNNRIPSFRPKELFWKARVLDPRIKQLYSNVMCISYLDLKTLNNILEFVKIIFLKRRKWSYRVERMFNEVLKSVKRSKELFVVNSRFFVLSAIKEILQGSEYDISIKYFDAKNHIRFLEVLNRYDRELYNVYLSIHNTCSLDNITQYVSEIENLLQNYVK